MAAHHEQPQDSSGKANCDSGQQEDEQGQPVGVGCFLQPIVELVALINRASKPAVYGANDVPKAHGGALAKVAKLMGQDAGKFAAVQSGDQRQSDPEHDVISEPTGEPGAKAGRCVRYQLE